MKHGGCFSGDTTVRTSNGDIRKLSELRIGDNVLTLDQSTGQLVFSEVILFLDRNTRQRREFLRIYTKSGQSLTLTPAHMLLIGNKTSTNTIYAEKIQVNDTLLVRVNDSLVEDSVRSIEPILLTGVYAPLTKTGTLIVNDVAVSCYAVVDSQSIAHWSFAPVRMFINIQEGFERLWHIVGKPMTGWELSASKSTIPDDGEYWYAKILYSLAEYLIPSHLNND